MKYTFFTTLFALLMTFDSSAQTEIQMKKINGVYTLPCNVNGLPLRFIFDTGASDVTISLTEALFMLKNGYLTKSDLKGTQSYQIANGEIVEGTKVLIRRLIIGDRVLRNIEASIVHELNAPLLLGQSALNQLGDISFDYSRNILKIGKPNTNIETSDFYIINVQATKSIEVAKKRVDELKRDGHKADYLWIPNYKSLSGAEYYSVYIGPFWSKKECEIATRKYRKLNPEAYGTLVSQVNQRVIIK